MWSRRRRRRDEDDRAAAGIIATMLGLRLEWPDAGWDGTPPDAAVELERLRDQLVAVVKETGPDAPVIRRHGEELLGMLQEATRAVVLLRGLPDRPVISVEQAQRVAAALTPWTRAAASVLESLTSSYRLPAPADPGGDGRVRVAVRWLDPATDQMTLTT